jgi:predicted O-methyltransferase YrrM
MSRKEEQIDKYILDHSEEEDPVLYELFRETHKKILHPRMLSGPMQGKFLEILVRMINPLNTLEIGTYTGYGTICMAKGMQNGSIDTIEINDELEEFIIHYFKKSGQKDKINLHIGDALKIVPSLQKSYDLCFIDGDKREYPQYLNLCKKYLKTGGFIIADNTLWDGKVLNNPKNFDNHTKGIHEFNKLVKDDSSLKKVILPVRDGLTIIQKYK